MRHSSYIRLNRKLVEEYGHFAAMVADCIRHQIEYHLSASYKDNPYLRSDGGLYYVNAPGSFICSWLICDRSTVRKNLIKLIDSGLILQELFTGRNGGSWVAFEINFTRTSIDFFDSKIRKMLIDEYESFSDEGTDGAPFLDVDNSKPGGDNITTGGDVITGGGDISTTSPLYNTNAQYLNPKDGGLVDYSFLNESDTRFISDIHAVYLKYFESDPVEMVKAAFTWKRCGDRSQKIIRDMYNQYGFEILAAACVFAFNERDLFSPLRFLGTVCARLQSQHAGQMQRRNLQRTSKPPNDRPPVKN